MFTPVNPLSFIPAPVQFSSLIQLAQENEAPEVLDTETTWVRGAISGVNYSRKFPYQLMVVEPDGATSYKTKRGLGWTFTLPIPPQNLSVSVPFAINTYITLDGVIEEHNGAPVRMIHMSGTTGVLFGKDSDVTATTSTLVDSIVGGTISSALQTAALVQGIANGNAFTVNAYDLQDFDVGGQVDRLTGYYQFRLLQQFFDAYAELKKTSDGRGARLAFCMFKDEAIYLCSPMSFNLNKGAHSPLEYLYDIQLKATKRINLNQTVVELTKDISPVSKDPSRLAQIANAMDQARAVLQGALKTITAISGTPFDIQDALLEPIREAGLFAKDSLDVAIALSDLPQAILADAKDAVVSSISTIKDVTNFKKNYSSKFGQIEANLNDQLDALLAIRNESKDNPNRGSAAIAKQGTHSAYNPFQNPSWNFKFFSCINVSSIKPDPVLATKIARERDRVRRFTRLNFQRLRDSVASVLASYTNAIGMGNATFNATYSIKAPSQPNIDVVTQDDLDVMGVLNDVIMHLNSLAATQNGNDTGSLVDSVAQIAGMAEQAGIAFKIPKSKYAVPFPYGYSVEVLAQVYLGDVNRWTEIAALNGLRSPFVDEVGFHYPLLTNGYGNKFSIDTNYNLYINQPIWLSSDTQYQELRHITKIDYINNNQHIITVDGNSDLDRFTRQKNASLHAYLPGTINSQQTIYIPSDTEPQGSGIKFKDIPSLDYNDKLIAVGGVDLLLTQKNDLVITPDGNIPLAVGLTNIVQKLRLGFSIRKGKLNQHPSYGLPIEVGIAKSDTDKNQLLRSIQNMVYADPSFSGISSLSVNLSGTAATLNLRVQVAGIRENIPISLNLI